MSHRLFTPRFFVMWGYSFTVFISLFQLLPTAPYHVIDLGGGTTAAGLFLGCLTYSSAFSAPFTGAVGDRFGQRRVLMFVSIMLAVFSVSYALITSIPLLLTVVVLHGFFWSALLSASGAYMTATIPETRRVEGISYWGLASTLSLAAAPPIGFWVYRHGWTALCIELVTLNIAMAIIAWRLPDDRDGVHGPISGVSPGLRQAGTDPSAPGLRRAGTDPSASSGTDPSVSIVSLWQRFSIRRVRSVIEARVIVLAITMAAVSFGYGAITSFSALFADDLHITPRSMFLSIMAVVIMLMRVTLGRWMDQYGHRRMLLRCLLVPGLGLILLAGARGPWTIAIAALTFGLGFGFMYPAFTAYVLRHVHFSRRGAAFGAMIAAFDTGVGSGSSVTGWLIHHFGYRPAFIVAGAVAMLSLPYFLIAERRLGFSEGHE